MTVSGATAGGRAAILIAATHSGAGKTTVASAVSRALRRRGLEVQPFKLGPDFIDPGYHAEAAGRPSINLDVWMMGERGVRQSYRRWSADSDIAVIEAMGALYDGQDGSGHGSAAHVAKLLGVPVVVVLDVWGMTRTAAAILDGLRAFDPALDIAGCVLNRVGSAKHAQMVVDALPPHLRRLVLGTIEHRPELGIPERHLGLVTVDENQAASGARGDAQARAGERLDLDRLVQLAGTAGPTAIAPAVGPPTKPVARLAVARDQAFCFYYEENLLLLRAAGWELVPFSPTADPRLPTDTDAVYIGGGYPEAFATQLAANAPLAAELRQRATDGMPIHAECGGLIYLARTLTRHPGDRHAMAGVLPLDVVMDPAHLAIRYVEARTRTASPLGPAETTIRGQEFHQSRIAASDLPPTLYDLTTSDGQTHRDGYQLRNVTASYVHLHLASNPQVAGALLQTAIQARPTTPLTTPP
jgi:cobyrinic acid a,c-diamide synthase